MLHNLVFKHRHAIFVSIACSFILTYSILLLTAPFLENSHPLQTALQFSGSLLRNKKGPREGCYLRFSCAFNVLVCIFTLSAVFLRPLIQWKWTNFLGLFSSLMMVATNWFIPLSLMNIMRASEKLVLPENLLIFRGLELEIRGGQQEFKSFVRLIMLLGFTLCVVCSGCTVAYWKHRFTQIVKSRLQQRQDSTFIQQQTSANTYNRIDRN